MRIILLGPPGAGKGTQAAKLVEEYQVAYIATGDILRAARNADTELGRKAREYMDRGELVPDEVVIGLVKERLAALKPGEGFILDGFPRTVPQAEALEGILQELGLNLDSVVEIEVNPVSVIRRLSRRRTCRQCGAVFHLDFQPPVREGVCDVCGGTLFQRVDDREETIRRRLEVYREQTQPLVDYYQKKGLLKKVNGEASVDEVAAAIRRAVGLSR